MTPAKTATRPAAEELPMGEPLPTELQIVPPAPAVVEQTFETIPVSLIHPGPHNPRRDLGELDGLVASIHAVGILEPLVVEACTKDGIAASDAWLLLAGHRRLAAAKLAGLAEVPCIVRATSATPALRMEMALIENLQREGLSPLDEADGYLELTKLGLSQRKIAERVGCSQSHVSKRLDLLALPKALQAKVGKKKDGLTLEAAQALTRLKDHPEKLEAVAKQRADLIVGAVEQAEADIAWEAKRAELVAAAKARKQTIVDEPRDQWSARKFKTLAKWGYKDREMDLDVRKHQGEPCHAVMIPKHRGYNEKPAATSVCTDPNRHTAKGASTLKVKVVSAPRRQPSAEEVQQAQAKVHAKEAAGARAAVLAKALADYSPKGPTSIELRMSLRGAVSAMRGYDTAQTACELLGLDHGDRIHVSTTYEALDRYADEMFPLQLHRAALALAFATVEAVLSGPYARWADKGVAEHYKYLTSLGYEPSPWETAQLAEAEQRAATGG